MNSSASNDHSPTEASGETKKATQKPNFFKRRLIVDPAFQFLMLGYTLFVIIATTSVGFLSGKLQDPTFLISYQLVNQSAVVASFALNLTVFMSVFLTMVFLSNRIAGPLYRLRNEMKRVAEGGQPKALVFRKSDLFKSLADEYNILVTKRIK